MCISWCANETDENKEKVKALIDASAKELTYEKKSHEEMERKVIKINLNP